MMTLGKIRMVKVSLFRPFVSFLMTAVNYIVHASVHWWGQTHNEDGCYANNLHTPPFLDLGTTYKTDISQCCTVRVHIGECCGASPRKRHSTRGTQTRFSNQRWPISSAFWHFCVLHHVLQETQRLTRYSKTCNFSKTHCHRPTN